MDFCSTKCEDIQGLLLHLKSHITEGKTVLCPFRQCDKKFTVKSPFTSHVSRKHKDYSERSLVESIASTSSTCDRNDEGCDTQLENRQSSDEDMEVYPERADEGEFIRHLVLFYLKLQAKLLLPSSTIQTIIEHYQEIHDINQSHLPSKLNEELTSLGLSEADINTVIDTLKNEDLHRASNTHTLKTDHKRKTFFKSNFIMWSHYPCTLVKMSQAKNVLDNMFL